MITLPSRQRSVVRGQTFGARGGSCSCDPCDCNPCKCGDGLVPNYPQWRASGYFVDSGSFSGQPLSERLLLSLAQPEREGSLQGWHEILLVGSETSLEQIDALLALFEVNLMSMPAEIDAPPQVTRVLYRASIAYQMTEKGPYLHVAFSPELANLVRAGSGLQKARAWIYDGLMRQRGNFHLPSR